MEIFERFPNKEAFDNYWKNEYIELTYEDVREKFEAVLKEAEGHIFLSDYEENGCISQADFKENLSQDAEFMFQDILTEIFYEKNPELYETAFEIYEVSQMSGEGDKAIAQTFHETYQKLYQDFLNQLYEEKIASGERK